MLTNTNRLRPGGWKYLLVLPALLGCTLLMAKSAVNGQRNKEGNLTTYNGNTFKWKTGTKARWDKPEEKAEVIYEMNGMPVYQSEDLATPASFGKEKRAFIEYIQKEFVIRRKASTDTLTGILVSNIVIDAEGRVVYYDLQSARPFTKNKYWSQFGNQDPELNAIMEKIIAESPRWKPAMKDGKPVACVMAMNEGC